MKPVAESDTSVQYKLTAADIRRIFTEQPTVKKAFEEWVPLKMNEVRRTRVHALSTIRSLQARSATFF